MALRKKLYYNVHFSLAGDTALSAGHSRVLRMTGNLARPNAGIVGAGASFGSAGADGDAYGNVLAPIEFAGLPIGAPTAQQRKSRQAISAWFQVSALTMGGVFSSQAFVQLDFIAPVASLNSAAGPSQVIAAAALADPVLNARPWIRLRRRAIDGTSSLTGRVYVQRQHAIEA